MSHKRKRRQEEPFQMAPMIDMVFLLLVFFMTVSTLAKEARPEIDLPVSAFAEVPEAAPPRDIITITPTDQGTEFYWHNRVVDLEQLGNHLSERQQKNTGHELIVRGPPDLPWERLHEVLNLCRDNGESDIIIATFER